MIPIILLTIEKTEDREFMVDLYVEYRAFLHYKAMAVLHDEDLVEDMIQTVLLKLIQNIERVKNVKKEVLPYYLAACVRNEVYSYLRRKRWKENILSKT